MKLPDDFDIDSLPVIGEGAEPATAQTQAVPPTPPTSSAPIAQTATQAAPQPQPQPQPQAADFDLDSLPEIRRFRMADGEDIDVDERAIARLRQGQIRNPFAPIGTDREAERAKVSRKVWKEAGLPEKYGRSQKDRDEVSRLILDAYDSETKAEEAARAARQNGAMAQLDATRQASEAQYQQMAQTQRELDYLDELKKAEAARPDLGVFGHAYLNAVATAGRDVGEGELIMRQLPIIGAFIDMDDAVVNANFRRFMNGEFKDSLAMGNAARSMKIPEDVIADVQRRSWSGERTAAGFPIVDQKKAAEEWKKVITPLYNAREAAKGRAVETLQEAAPLTATQEILSGAMTLPKMVVDLTPLGAGITSVPKMVAMADSLIERGDSAGTALAKSAASVGGEYFIWNKLGKVIDALPGVGTAVKSAGQALARNKVTGNVIARNAGQILEMNAKSGLTELVNDVVGMGKADNEEKKEFSEWFQDFVSVPGNAKKMLMMLPAHLLMKGVGKGKQLLSKEGRETAGEIKSQRAIIEATIGEEAARGLSDADVQNIYKIVSSPNLSEKSISDTLSFIEGKAGTENRQAALKELRKQLREGRKQAEGRIAAEVGAEKAYAEQDASIRDNAMRQEAARRGITDEKEIKKFGKLYDEYAKTETVQPFDEWLDERKSTSRAENEAAREQKRQRKADEAAEKARAEEEYRKAQEEQERAIAEKTAEDNKPTIRVTVQEAESAPANRLTEYPEYAEWLRKNGRSDTDKNWNKFVAQNEMDPALKVVRDKKGNPAEPEAKEPEVSEQKPVEKPQGQEGKTPEPPAPAKKEIAEEAKPPVRETEDAGNPAKTEPAITPSAEGATARPEIGKPEVKSGGRLIADIPVGEEFEYQGRKMVKTADGNILENPTITVGKDGKPVLTGEPVREKMSGAVEDAEMQMQVKPPAAEPAKTAPASAPGAEGTTTPKNGAEPPQGAETGTGDAVKPKSDMEGKIARAAEIISDHVRKKTGDEKFTADNARQSAESLVKAIEEKNADALRSRFNGLNQGSVKAFEALTGLKMPKSQKGQHEVVDRFCGVTPEERARIDGERAAKHKEEAERQRIEQSLKDGEKAVKSMRVELPDGKVTTADELVRQGWIVEKAKRGAANYLRIRKPDGSGYFRFNETTAYDYLKKLEADAKSSKPVPDGKGKMVKPATAAPPNATAPVVDETGKTAEVVPPDSVEARISAMKRGSPEQLKAQREYLEQEIAKARAAIDGKFEKLDNYGGRGRVKWLPKDEADDLPPTVTVKVPGDGEFTVKNTPEGMDFLDKIAAKFKPQKSGKAAEVSAPSVPKPPTVTVAKKPKEEPAHKEMEPFVSTDRTRASLMKPMSDGEYVYATNGPIAIRRPLRKGEKVKGADGAPVESVAGFFDNPEPNHSFKVKVAELYPKLVQADAVTGDGDGKGIVELWHDGNGTLHVRARDGEGNSYATDAGSDYVSRPLTLVNGQYLRDFLKLAAKRGAGEVEIGIVENGIAKQADAVTLKGGDLEGVLVSIRNSKDMFKARAENDARLETNRMLAYGERAWVDSLPKKLREERDGLVATASQSGTAIDNDLKAKIAKAKDDLAAFDAKHGKSEFVSEFVKNGGKAPANPKKGKGGADGKLKAVNPDADEAPASGAKKTQGEFDFGESAKKPENPAKKGAATDGGKAAGISFIEPLPEGKPESKTPEQEIVERLDLARLDPKRRSDPKVLEWAKKNNRTVTNGMVTPDAVRAYDEQMTERAAKQGRRWFPDMKIVTHKYGETIKRGQHVIEARRVGKVSQRVPKSERGVFRGEFNKVLADYAHNNNGDTPKSCGLFTSEAYYVFDIIGGEPLDIHRIKINDRNREKITAFDKKHKAEIYRGTRSSAEWARRIEDEVLGLLQDHNGSKNGKAGGGNAALDVPLRQGKRGFPEPLGNDAQGKGESVPVSAETHYLRDRAGRVLGWFDPQSKEVHLLPGADPRTVAHEIMWHGTRDYISGLAAKGDARARKFLDMMHDVEQNAPQAIKDVVNRLYARGGSPVSRDTLLNEYGAWFTMDKGGAALEKAMQTAEGRNWFAKGFHAVKEMYKDYLTRHGKNRVDLSAVDGMSRDQFVDWIADQFAGGKALGTIKGEPQKVLSTKETRMQAYRRKAYDNNAPLRDLERDVEKKTGRKISTDDSVEAANALKHGLKEAANIEIQGKMSDFRKALGESGIHYEDLEYYAALKAAAGRDAKIDARNLAKIEADMRAQGASQADIDAAKANYRSVNGSHIDPREARRMLAEIEGGPDAAKYKAAYDKLRAVIDETLAVQEQSGLVGAADAAKWRAEEPNYVPFKNEYEPETGEWAGRGSSRNFTRPEHHTAKGRQSAAGDIIAHVFMDHQAAKHRAIENAVRQKLAKLVRANPELGTVERLGKDAVRNIEKDDPNVVVFKEGGNAYAIRLEGTRGAAIANAFTERNLLKMGWADKGLSVFGKKISFRSFSHWSAGMSTRYSPTFAVRNTLKDNIELANIVYSERGFLAGSKWMGQYVANRARMSKTLMKYVATGRVDAATPEGALLDRYIKAGGLIAGGTRAEAFEGIKQKLSPEAIAKEMKRGSSKTRAAAKHVLKSIAYLNEYAEMATRLGVFATEVKGGKSDAEAALFSRRATVDFNRHGDYTPAFNMLRLFSNSTLGATARAATALCKSKFGKRAALLMFANGLARAFIDHYLNEDEDKAREARGNATGKDVSEYDRRTSLFYFRNGDKLYKVAQHESPFSLITYAGDCVGRWLCGDLGGAEAAKNIGVTTAELAWNFTPMGQINVTSREGGGVNDFKAALVSGVCPSILQPIAEIAMNIDYKGDPVCRQMFDNYAPQSHNGKAHTPDWAKSSAEWANEATGGNAGRRGWFDISPEVVQKLVEGYGKNALRDVSTALSVGEAIVKGDTSGLDPRNTPVKRDFVRPLDGNDGRYFQAVDRHKADRKDFDTGRATRSKEENESYLAAHPSAYNSVHQSLGKIEDAVNRLRKMENGYAVPKKGAAVPHKWTDEELERFRGERRRLQAQYLSIMQRMDERAK